MRKLKTGVDTKDRTMPIGFIDHVNIRCEDLDESRRFYVEVIGLSDGDRPPMSTPGAWLYSGGHPLVHLVDRKAEGSISQPRQQLADDDVDLRVTGSFDHIALNATGLAEMQTRLKAMDIPYKETIVPRSGAHQLFLRDPDGVKIELNYPAVE